MSKKSKYIPSRKACAKYSGKKQKNKIFSLQDLRNIIYLVFPIEVVNYVWRYFVIIIKIRK